MADVKEYIVRIKGDTSQLEAAADRAQAKFEKLSDTEVRLKVNFGKNNADIKPLLNEIKKVDPEIHTKMVIDGLEELRQIEERLEQIKKMEKDIGSGSVDAIRASLEKKFKDIQEAEKEAGTLDELDNSKVASGLKDVLNYIESIGKAADDVTISPLIKQIREFAGWYEDELAGFKPQNLLDQKDELQNRLSSLSKSIGDIPEQDQIEARISKYIDELYGIEDRIDAGLESDSSNLIKKLKEASDYLDQIEKKYGKIEGSDLVDELKGIRRERAAELDDYISRNSKGKKKEKAVKNKEIEKKDEPIDDDTFDSWLDEMDQEVKKTEKLTEARKEAANANKEEAPYESHVDEIKEETKSYEELAKAREKASKAEKLAHGLVDAQDKLFELEKERDELNKSSEPINARLLEAKHTDKYSDDEVKELEERKKKLVSAKGKNTKEQTKQKNFLKEHEQELYDELARLSTEISDLESRQYSLSDIDDEKQYRLLRKKLSLKKGDKGKIEEVGTYSGKDLKALLESEYEYSKGKWKNKANRDIYDIEGSTEISDTIKELKRAEAKLDGAKQYLEHPYNEDTVNYAHNLFSDTSSIEEETAAVEKNTQAKKDAKSVSKEEVPYESHADEINKEAEAYEKYAEAQRLAAIQNEYSRGMGVESIGGFDPERQYMRLNELAGEYEQTMREIDDLQHSGSNNEDIQERIALLKLLAQNQIEAFARSIPNDMTPSTAVAEAFDGSPKIWGDYLDGVYNRLASENDNYVKSVWEKISSLAKELPDGFVTNLGDRVIDPNSLDVMSSIAEETKRIKEAGEEAGDEYQRQLDKEAQELAEKKAREEEYRRQEEEAAREAAEEELRIAEEKAQREAEIEEEARRRTEKEMEEYERQALERIEAEKNLESAADSVDKESGSSGALIDANNQIGESAKEAEQKIKELENAVAELMSITSNASGGKLAVGEMIRNWIDSDKDIINRSGIKALLERSAVLDKDGNIYGGYSYGKAGKTGVSNATKERMKSSGVSPWAEFHSHSSAKIASASEADFIQFIKDYKEYGIAMQGIIAQDDIELFDMAAIMRDHKDKLEGLTKEDLIKKFKEGSLVSASSYFEDFISQYASNGLEEGLGYLGIALKNNGVDINLSDFKTIATDMMRDPNNKLAITELLINAVTGSMKDPSALNSQLESVIAQHTSGSTLASYFGYNDEDIQHYRRKAASKSIFQELFGTEDLSKYITHYTPDEFIEQNPLKLPDLSANENSMRNYAKATEEAADATAKLNKEEEKSVDNSDEHRKQQELAREYNEQLYESKGALPSPDDYDSYYDSDGISRFIEQTKEARIETENLNDAIRDGSVQSDDISKHTEDLKEDSKAANENAEANKKAAEAKKESASVQQEPERDLSAESLDLDKEASLRRLDVLEKKLREVGGASKELENDLVDARKAIGSAVDTKELGVANKKVRNITDDVNEYIKQKNIEVDYSDQLSSFEKLKNEIVESTAVSEAFKDSVKGAFDSFKDASASTKNIERIKEAIKETTKEFKEYAKASAADNSKANTRFSNYVDRLNSYNLDKYTPEVRQKILDLRDEISKMPKDAAGNFKIDLNDEEVVKQVNRIDGAMKDLKAAVSSADGVVANGISVKKLNEQMAQFVNKNHKLTAEYKQEVKELRQALSEEGLTKSGYMDILGQYKDLQARASDEGLVGGVGNLENLGNQIKRMSTNFVAQYFSLYDIVRYAKEIGQSVTEINSAQTELRKVSDASQTRIQENFQKSAETAQEMGATISDVINSTSDWARLGYSVDEAEVLARNTALYQTVGDNMTQESASEYMTSIMKGYQYDADQSESIIDKVNEVANNYSIDTQGLGEALQRSASAFNTAHTDLDKSIAIITASNEVLNLWHAA